MIEFTKPANLNGAELIIELKTAGVKITNDPTIDGEGKFWLDIAETDKAKATSIIAAHNGTLVTPELTIAEKLASVGLSIAELKAALA